IIVVDKTNQAPGKIKLNYLVDSVNWRPQYRFRAGKGENEQIRIEYLAGVLQQTGEEWNNVKLTLSTAQPMLNAAPPDLKSLAVALMPRGPGGNPMAGVGQLGGFGLQGGQIGQAGGGGQPQQPGNSISNKDLQQEVFKESQRLRGAASKNYSDKKGEEGGRQLNDAAALEQANEILLVEKDELLNRRNRPPVASEGQSVTYHLDRKLSVPSRNEEHVIEMTRLEMKP